MYNRIVFQSFWGIDHLTSLYSGVWRCVLILPHKTIKKAQRNIIIVVDSIIATFFPPSMEIILEKSILKIAKGIATSNTEIRHAISTCQTLEGNGFSIPI